MRLCLLRRLFEELHALGDDEPCCAGDDADIYLAAVESFTVDIYHVVLVKPDLYGSALEVSHMLRQLVRLTGSVFTYKRGKGDEVYGAYDKEIKPPP